MVALVAGLASEVARTLIKGRDYAFSYLNDIHWYSAMAVRLWDEPISVVDELDLVGLSVASVEIQRAFAPETLTSAYLHLENGLAHQPPYAYRVFVPATAGLLANLGFPLYWAFCIIYLLGVALLALFSYRLVARAWNPSLAASTVMASVLVAALATTSPGYPDMSFLGFAAVAVWGASRRSIWIFCLTAILATASRETGIALAGVWLAYSWAHGTSWARQWIPPLVPITTLLSIRLLTQVPNSHVDYGRLVGSLATPGNLTVGLCALITISLVSPLILRLTRLDKVRRLAYAEGAICLVGAGVALVGMVLATNTSRMALLAVPFLIAPLGWFQARTRLWLVLAATSGVGYAVADTLANRANAPFGSWPWVATALLVAMLGGESLRREMLQAARSSSSAGNISTSST